MNTIPTHDIVPTHLAVTAMRDNGYKNAAYAIAELIDNSIQAGATQVELLCADKTELRRQRKSTQVHQIAVLDNGSGMSTEVLHLALQFGNGMYLNPNKHTGIGRFGMGLPSSSISQCRRVEVWSWQNGIDSAIYSYLDLDQIASGEIRQVPPPESVSVPDLWKSMGQSIGDSGTLVVWSRIDRSLWSRSKTIIDKSEFIIGRIYRRFLVDGRAKIRFVTFDVDDPLDSFVERWARPNDPMYLMSDTSCPPDLPYIQKGEPMFVQWGESDLFEIEFNGQTHEVKVKYSLARNEARTGRNAGSRDHGRHAARNVGVSIMRADRELDLDPAWSSPSEARDRWWGVEIDVPPALDDLFGVTNNKQSARYFSDLAKINVKEMMDDDKSFTSAREEYESESDPQWPLFEIAKVIQKQIIEMRNWVGEQKKGTGQKRSIDDNNSPEIIATQVTNRRREQGYEGQSDKQEKKPKSERISDIQQGLMDLGVTQTEDEAEALAAQIVGRGLKYDFREAGIATSPAFFDVQSRGGNIIITMNTRHPAYPNLIEVLDSDVEGVNTEELRNRLIRASDGLRLLLSAWARYEDEQPDGTRRTRAQDTRWDWGRMAREFLEDEYD